MSEGNDSGGMYMRKILKIAIGVAGAASLATAASAGSVQANLAVGSSIVATCSISTTAVAFGQYTGSEILATGGVSATCVNGTDYDIGLDAGLTTGATVTSRKMKSGANVLPYELYSNSDRTTNWGNTVGTDTVHGTGTGTSQNLNVYAKLPAGSVPAAGTYSDTVKATISF